MKKIMIIAAAALSLAACTTKSSSTQEQNQETVNQNQETVMTQEQQVFDLLKAIETGASEPIAYINADKYIQHNLGAEDGLAGFGKLMGVLAHFRNRFFFLFAFPPERSPDGTCR